MVRRTETLAHDHDDDSLSEDIDDASLEIAEPKRAKKVRSDVPWVLKYEPQSVLEVSINPRKSNEVRDVFRQMASGASACRLLVLSGPAGSSKSTLAKALAKEVFSSPSHPLGYVEYLDSSLDSVGQAHHFREFMDGCRYLVGQNRCAVLVEDLPNVFHEETLRTLRDCLKNWVFSSREIELPPVVLCITEVEIVGEHGQRGYYNIENCLTVETILGRDLLNAGASSGSIRRVKFLPVAKTYIKKSLQRIVNSERLRHKVDLDALYESGDIRSSISNMEFMSNGAGTGLQECMRESQITLFHAVGKVVHSSSRSRDATSRDHAEYSSDYESVRHVVDSYHNFGLLHLALLENYQIYNGSQFGVDIAANIVDALSLNDTFKSPEASHDYAIRATRQELAKVQVKSSRTLPMKFPRHFKSVREENKVKGEVANYVRYLAGLTVSFNEANLLDGFFVPRIKNSGKYQRLFGRKRYLYNRVGGSFKEIYADEDLPVLEHDNEISASVKDQFSEDIMATIREQEDGQNQSDMEAEDSDEIEDSATEDDDLDDTLDEHILSISTQNHQSHVSEDFQKSISEDEFSDDPELAFLVSQGKL